MPSDDLSWGRVRCAAAGLEPPYVEIVIRENTSECNWRRGLYYPRENTIVICHMNRETVVYEMAHTWLDANLDSPKRTEFLDLRGLAAWNDHSLPWHERGTEHAAEIVAWAVEQGNRMVTWVEGGQSELRLLSIANSTVDQLLEGTGCSPVSSQMFRAGTLDLVAWLSFLQRRAELPNRLRLLERILRNHGHPTPRPG